MKMMDKYLELKEQDNDKVYIFECGVFYICFNDDADIISEKLKLKVVALNDIDYKCGFPIKVKDKYFSMLDDMEILYEVIEAEKKPMKISVKKVDIEKEIIRKLRSINVEYYTADEALRFLIELKELLK